MRLRKKQQQFIETATAKGGSFSALFWKRFKRNKMAMTSIIVIVLFAIVALLGYLITPDHTPYCNQQYRARLAVFRAVKHGASTYKM